ncbi:MAG: bifunctional DNA-formamidopyrimidine glycosylase/DNA-(apurinic or apyrimidinic site) lyase [Acidaminococcaceae bacterium]|jgi:formamidopyrimidine-DNA glycosylase|nr:bifunctional DNA-formamidopyrimidine glycosylase/DNA-(apurinic or apyrimidinic site) lyase [Acidaminococcaceae bacterium]
MPELPEVEQVRKTLSPHVVGQTIKEVEIRLPRLIQYPTAEEFAGKLKGKTIESIERRGKYLRLNVGKDTYILVHLRMTGALLAVAKTAPEPDYAKIRFVLTGPEDLWFTDIRTFGTLYLIDHDDKIIEGYATLGPEPVGKGLTADYLEKACLKKTGAIKAVILDQKIVAGLGNIYADEALFAAGILPTRQANKLTKEEYEKLVQAMKKVIAQGIKNHGTTFRNYQDADGHKGDNVRHLMVYGRKAEPCKVCGTALEQIKVAGRGSVYCPHCQK